MDVLCRPPLFKLLIGFTLLPTRPNGDRSRLDHVDATYRVCCVVFIHSVLSFLSIVPCVWHSFLNTSHCNLQLLTQISFQMYNFVLNFTNQNDDI